MAIERVALTPAEQALIKEKRNQDCQEGNHILGMQKLRNGRLCKYCPNCLWAELDPVKNLQVGQTPIVIQMADAWNPNAR